MGVSRAASTARLGGWLGRVEGRVERHRDGGRILILHQGQEAVVNTDANENCQKWPQGSCFTGGHRIRERLLCARTASAVPEYGGSIKMRPRDGGDFSKV